MTTQAVVEHFQLARDFLDQSRDYFRQGDLHQASEKGWCAAAHLVKAVAAANNWKYEHHDEFDSVITNARQRYRQPSLRQYSNSAHALHRNYYKRGLLLNAGTIKESIDDVEAMLDILQPFIVN